jgi:hypothetical protein
MHDDPRPEDRPDDRPEDSDLPGELDEGLACAYGGADSAEGAPSVLDRIGDMIGATPRVPARRRAG